MRNKPFPVIAILLGIALIAASSAFIAVRFIQKNQSSEKLSETVEKIEKCMPEASAGFIEERSDTSMPAIEIDGRDYIGILELPGRTLKLPVAANWSSSGLSFRPAKYIGSVYDGSLIIGGRYEEGNFDFADLIDAGEEVTFTDMTGKKFRYTVAKINHSDDAKTETLADSDYQLTLFVKKESTFLIIRCEIA